MFDRQQTKHAITTCLHCCLPIKRRLKKNPQLVKERESLQVSYQQNSAIEFIYNLLDLSLTLYHNVITRKNQVL